MRGGYRSVPPSLPAVPASRSPFLAGGEAMQDRALALGAVGLGGTDEFGWESRCRKAERAHHPMSQSFSFANTASHFISRPEGVIGGWPPTKFAASSENSSQ